MQEQALWQSITNIEASMKTMHENLDDIITACTTPEHELIRLCAEAMRTRINSAFEAKFALVDAMYTRSDARAEEESEP